MENEPVVLRDGMRTKKLNKFLFFFFNFLRYLELVNFTEPANIVLRIRDYDQQFLKKQLIFFFYSLFCTKL